MRIGGSLPAAPVEVQLVAWPNEAVLASLPDGAVVQTISIGRATTDAVGGFAIAAPMVDLPASYVDSDGSVDFELEGVYEGRQLRLDFSASRGRASDGSFSWGSRGKQAEVLIDFGKASGVRMIADDPATWVDASGNVGTLDEQGGLLAQRASEAAPGSSATLTLTSDGHVVRPDATGPCTEVAGAWTYGVDEYFIKAYGWSGAKATLHQEVGAIHTLGVAGAFSGGSYSQTGTTNFGVNSTSANTVPGVVDALAHDLVNYRRYSNSCTGYSVKRATSWSSLLDNFTYAPHVNFSTCSSTFYSGATPSKTAGTNVTYGAGVSLGAITLSAQSGHTATSKTMWVITKESRICGSNPQGWASSPQASAKTA